MGGERGRNKLEEEGKEEQRREERTERKEIGGIRL